MEILTYSANQPYNEPLEVALSNISVHLLNPQARILCCCGAGISTEVGLRDFRSPSGIYSNSVASTSAAISPAKARALFDSTAYLNPVTRADHWKYISTLHDQIDALNGTTTSSHKFFKRLAKKKKLLRVYSQNIDGLEKNANLTYVGLKKLLDDGASDFEGIGERESVSNGKKREYFGNVVQLHGT